MSPATDAPLARPARRASAGGRKGSRRHKARRACERRLERDPGSVQARKLLAEALLQEGKFASAYGHYRALLRSGRDCGLTRARLTQVLRYLKLEDAPDTIEGDLVAYLGRDDLNHDDLAQLASGLLARRYVHTDTDAPPAIETLVRDTLLVGALRRVFLVDPGVELFLVALRRRLLQESLARPQIPRAWLALIGALAQHSFNSEYVHFEQADEIQMVDGLDELLAQLTAEPAWTPQGVHAALLLACMYRPAHALRAADRLAGVAPEAWPPPARAVLERALHEIRDEHARAAQIPALMGIHDTVSRRVQAQYEHNPYPRWASLVRADPVPYAVALRNDLPGFRPPDFLEQGPVDVLVAGCGSGREALMVALARSGARVLAVDLSRRSLAYASRMAERYAITNVEFRHADILALDALTRRFQVIHCSGVLHHMSAPESGLAVLRKLLVPGGLLSLGLYSELARRHVVRAREVIAKLGFTPSPRDIRGFRAGLLAGVDDPLLRRAFKTRDFFSMSGCRDLLFHVQEHQFTTEGLAAMLDAHGLEFLGFHAIPPRIAEVYRAWFPSDGALRCLASWGMLEAMFPDTFQGMYKFWCRTAV